MVVGGTSSVAVVHGPGSRSLQVVLGGEFVCACGHHTRAFNDHSARSHDR
jgi:hypothetical protein